MKYILLLTAISIFSGCSAFKAQNEGIGSQSSKSFELVEVKGGGKSAAELKEDKRGQIYFRRVM